MMLMPSLYICRRESPLLPKFSGQWLVITRSAAARHGTAARKGASTGSEAWRTMRSHSRPAVMARALLHVVTIDMVLERRELGMCRDMCSLTYQDSNTE